MFTQTVAIRDVKFFAYHGFYPEEQLIGNHFLVDAIVTFIPFGETENIETTVNYEVLNQIMIEQMGQTQKMLETVVKNILDAVIATYPYLLTATVSITKLTPLMKGEVGQSFVQLSYKAEN